MNDLFLVLAVLLANSTLNVITWMFIIGKLGNETKGIIQKIQNIIEVIQK